MMKLTMKLPTILFKLISYFLFAVVLGLGQRPSVIFAEEMIMDIKHSKDSTVQISSKQINSKGSGAIFNSDYVITAFHVIAKISDDGKNRMRWDVPSDLAVTFPDGETIQATCVSLPSEAEPQPLLYDFAVLKLRVKPHGAWQSIALTDAPETIEVGDEIIFSGFPLATPGMVTHKGMISGFDAKKDLIFIQAPINKGNSGGLVLNQAGQAIGIMSMREGGISKGLSDLSAYIETTSQHGSVKIMGVDPLQSTRAIIQTLDQYISTGIGYAISIKFLKDYLAKHPLGNK